MATKNEIEKLEIDLKSNKKEKNFLMINILN